MTIRTSATQRLVESIQIVPERALGDEPLHHRTFGKERDNRCRDKPVHHFRCRRIADRRRAGIPGQRHETFPGNGTEQNANAAKLSAMTAL
jgi:hypothetical protein